MSVVHLLVPGLGRRHLDDVLAHGALQSHPPWRQSDLVLSFPATIANVQATMLAGRTALGRGEIPFEVLTAASSVLAGVPDGVRVQAPSRALPDVLPRSGAVHLLYLGLFEAIAGHGFSSPAERAALGALDEILRVILGDGGHALVLAGGPPLQRCTEQVRLPGWIEAATRVEGALAFVSRTLAPPERDAVLTIPGVERVLQGGALISWGVPETTGSIVLAAPGCSFGPGSTAHGHREILDVGDTPRVLAWGGRSSAAWPAAVHDHRLGPTIAIAAGLTPTLADDEPLPW